VDDLPSVSDSVQGSNEFALTRNPIPLIIDVLFAERGN
jgi:hypothetical protein